MGYFGNFKILRVFQSFFRFRGYFGNFKFMGVFWSFSGFRGYFDNFLCFEDILVIF